MKIIPALFLVLVTLALANSLAGTEARVSALYRARDNTDQVIPHEKVYNSASEPASSDQNPNLHEILKSFACTIKDNESPGPNNFSLLPNQNWSHIICTSHYNSNSHDEMVHPSKFNNINHLHLYNSKKPRFMTESELDMLPPLLPMDAGQPPSPKRPPSILSVQPPPKELSSVMSVQPPPKELSSVLSVQPLPSPRKLTSVLIERLPPPRKTPSVLSVGPPPSPERPPSSASKMSSSNRI